MCILHCLPKGCWRDSGYNLEAPARIRGGTVLCFEQSRKHRKCAFCLDIALFGQGLMERFGVQSGSSCEDSGWDCSMFLNNPEKRETIAFCLYFALVGEGLLEGFGRQCGS
jgi:hypothetical protein